MLVEVLVTVHGIQSRGSWHQRVANALEPHFDCRKIDYWGYRNLGPVVFAAMPIGALLVLAAVAALVFGRLQPNSVGFIGLAGSGIALAAAGGVLQRRALRSVMDQIRDANSGNPVLPHLIAHSLGTFLCCWGLHDYAVIRFEKMILVGCILPLTFPWQGVLGDKPNAFKSIRNEVGLGDWVVWLARVVGFAVRRVGDAGRGGFHCDGHLIHDRATWKPCSDCSENVRAPIHNFRQHSSHWISFFERGYPRDIWLPYLWGYEPAEFEEYRQLCREGYLAVAQGLNRRASRVENAFRRQRWTWTGNSPVDEYLAELAGEYFADRGRAVIHPHEIYRVQRDAIHRIWMMNAAAEHEWRKPAAERNDDVVRRMKPEWLFEEAVKRAVNE